MTYRVEYSPEVEAHLRALPKREQAIVLDRAEASLSQQPMTETRNRKRLRVNPFAGWELRIGELRVYFDVEEEPEPIVKVRAVGMKRRNRVYIGGEAIEL